MISAVIFDMDGVIIDSEPVYFQIENELFGELGLELTQNEHSKFVGRSDLWEFVKEYYKLEFEVDEIKTKQRQKFLSHLENSFTEGPISGVPELIKKFDTLGISLALASSSSRKIIMYILEMFDLKKFFPIIVSGAELETSKPHPEIFLKASELIGIEPQNCLVIEDSENGVRAAKAAGMKCVGYKNVNSGRQDLSLADWTIEHFSEFDWNRYNNEIIV